MGSAGLIHLHLFSSKSTLLCQWHALGPEKRPEFLHIWISLQDYAKENYYLKLERECGTFCDDTSEAETPKTDTDWDQRV